MSEVSDPSWIEDFARALDLEVTGKKLFERGDLYWVSFENPFYKIYLDTVSEILSVELAVLELEQGRSRKVNYIHLYKWQTGSMTISISADSIYFRLHKTPMRSEEIEIELRRSGWSRIQIGRM
jgi:hypothetical protein